LTTNLTIGSRSCAFVWFLRLVTAAETGGVGAYIQAASRPWDGLCAAAPGDEHMIRWTRLAAAFVLGAGLTVAGAAPAQTQSGNAAAPGQPAPPPAQSTTPSIKSWDPDASKPWDPNASKPWDPNASQPWDPNARQPVYSVPPPPDGPSGIYLPAVVGGYAKSVAGCVLVGCNDGPQVGGASGSSSSSSNGPPPAVNVGPSGPR
jgi:hypothetical protein